jgi:hypothetical protein
MARMKLRVIILVLAVFVSGVAGYLFGYYNGWMRSHRYWMTEAPNRWRANGKHQAYICLGALTNLSAGKESEAETILQNYLSEGVGRYVSGLTNAPRDELGDREITLIRMVRDYRLQHPWTNDEPERAERLQEAFKWSK